MTNIRQKIDRVRREVQEKNHNQSAPNEDEMFDKISQFDRQLGRLFNEAEDVVSEIRSFMAQTESGIAKGFIKDRGIDVLDMENRIDSIRSSLRDFSEELERKLGRR